MSRRVLVVLALTVAVGLVWFSFLRVRGAYNVAPRARGDENEPSRAETIPNAPDSSTVDEPRRTAAASGEMRAKSAASSGISGTVVLLDGGERNERANGEFALYWTNAEGLGNFADVAVVNGAWELALDGFAHGETRAFVLEGRPAFARRTADVEVRANHGQVLEVWAASVIRLHVLDAQTGLELPEAEVWIEERGRVLTNGDRPERRWVSYEEAQGRSPLVLEANHDWCGPGGTAKAFARAPGYAWKCCQLSFLGGGERFVELSPGGDLVVQFLDPFPDVVTAELRTLGNKHVAEGKPTGGDSEDERIEFANVPEGDYQLVFLNRGFLPRERRVSIVAGSSVTELVEEEPSVEEEWASIAGDLVVPESWRTEAVDDEEFWRASVPELGDEQGGPTLVIQHALGIAQPELVPQDAPGMWTWSARIPVGPCTFAVAPSSYTSKRVVRDGDRVHLELPSLVDILVACRLPDGVPVGVAHISWSHEEFTNLRSHPGPTPEAPAVLAAPRGRVSFSIYDARLRITGPREFDVVADGPMIELRVRPVQGVDLAFRHDEAFFVFDACEGSELAGSASAQIETCHWNGLFLRLELAEAGPVTLSFATRPDGFQPIADLVVDVPLGGFVEREVQLVPRR